MRKKKGILIAGICICLLLLVAGVTLLQPKDGSGASQNETSEKDKVVTLQQAREQFAVDIKELKDGAYDNLIAKDFTASIEEAESLYHFQILRNQEYETTLENVGSMVEALEKFFGDPLDKSILFHKVFPLDENGEIPSDSIGEEICYDEFMKRLEVDDGTKYAFIGGFRLGNEWYAHIDAAFGNIWFSKRTLGTGLPGGEWPMKEYLYVTGIRQEDTTIRLQDKEYSLTELEKNVLDYVNGAAFPLPHHEEISYQIGSTHVMDMGDKDCINFVLRRVYKGVPFEYGSESASGGYIDKFEHDYTTINYVEGTQPDTMMGFMDLKGTIEVTEKITEMISAREALRLLSEKIGENSIYEVYGVELVYRNGVTMEDMPQGISDILEPKWKIITVNQNDDKYTLFYVDVVTGEITNRFEYYYQ